MSLFQFKKTLFHVVGNHKDQCIFLLSVGKGKCSLDHSFNIVAIKTILGEILWVAQRGWTSGKNFFLLEWDMANPRQRKIRHNKQLIPELVLKIRNISKMWIQISHNTDNCMRHFISLFFFGFFHRLIHHLLNVTTIFWNS